MKKQQQHQKEKDQKEKVRLTIDFPIEQHAFLKMLAAKKGVSMRQYIIDSLSHMFENEVSHIDLSENKFKKSLNKIIDENDDILRRLAGK